MHKFDFSIRQWLPSSSFDVFGGSEFTIGSGPYDFWPLPGQYESSEYTTLIGEPTISVNKPDMGVLHFEFGESFSQEERWFNSGPSEEKLLKRANVHVSLDYDTPAVKFCVDIGGLPRPNYSDGNEVVVNF